VPAAGLRPLASPHFDQSVSARIDQRALR